MPEPTPFPTGVLIQPDATYTDLAVTEDRRRPILLDALDGEPVFAYYWRPGGEAICVIVCETSEADGLPMNGLATRLVERVRGGLLPYAVHGPAVVLGYHPQADQLTHLSDAHRDLLAEIVIHEAEERLA